MMSNKFAVVMKADVPEMTMYDSFSRFDGISASMVYGRLKKLGDVKRLRVRLNSSGGSIIEGTAIYNILKNHPARVTVTIDGIAASMASVVAMAGDEIEMGEGAYMMIHDPLGEEIGTAAELRDMADTLDKMRGQLVSIYANRTRQDEKQIKKWMAEETWMTADEAIANGFADRSVKGLKVAASATAYFDNVPEVLLHREQPRAEGKPPEKEGDVSMSDTNDKKTPQPATYAEIKAACVGADRDFIGQQVEASATAETAVAAWMSTLQERADAAEKARAEADEQAAEAKAEAEKAKAEKPGVKMLGSGGKKTTTDDADPIGAFRLAVEEKMKLNMTKSDAARAVVGEQPELHKAYVEAHNEQVRA